ncbi:MAG: ATP-grasp domain-containing protein [Pseudobdellovibrionaceae bacterium]
MKKIIVIETSDIGAKYTVKAAEHLGYETLFLANLGNYQADTKKELLESQYIDCDTTSADSLYQTLKQNNIQDIAGVITFLDSRLVVASELAKKLGVNGINESVIGLKDKGHVQNLIPQFSPPTITFKLTQFPYEEIKQLFQKFEKIIIKPTLTAGALGVEIIESPNELNGIANKLANSNLPDFLNNNTWVAQAYLDGPLYSIEGYVKNGELNILGISDRFKVGKTES